MTMREKGGMCWGKANTQGRCQAVRRSLGLSPCTMGRPQGVQQRNDILIFAADRPRTAPWEADRKVACSKGLEMGDSDSKGWGGHCPPPSR